MSDETYKGHPVSIGERRSEKEQDGRLWTPRDALIHLLRKIDSGEMNVTSLVVAYRETKDGKHFTHFSQSTPDILQAVGLIEYAKFHIME